MAQDLRMEHLMENIQTLVARKNLRISDIEKEIGISNGYLGRMLRKGNAASPSIEIIWKLANFFDVSVERLVDGDITDPYDHMRLVIATMNFCKMNTLCGAMSWQTITIDEINAQLHFERPTIPIIGYCKKSVPRDDPYADIVPNGVSESCVNERAIRSHMFPNTKLYATGSGLKGLVIEGNWFHIYKLGGVFLPIQSDPHGECIPSFETFYDVWIEDKKDESKPFSFVCTTRGADLQLREAIDDLYEVVLKAGTIVILEPKIRSLFETYLATSQMDETQNSIP